MMSNFKPTAIVNSGALSGQKIDEFEVDAVNLVGNDSSVADCDMVDTFYNAEAHRDFVQIIPKGIEPNAQFFGAASDSNFVSGCTMHSKGMCQGITAFDGVLTNVIVEDNHIVTNSEHKITLAGVLSGAFNSNIDGYGNPIEIVLEPLRIGGGHYKRFWVTSFLSHAYEPIEGNSPVRDLRSKKHREGDRYVDNFNLDLFRLISEDVEYVHNGFDAHFERVLSLFDVASLEYSSTTMLITNGYVHIDDYRDMTATDLVWWTERWCNFKPYEVASDNFDIKFSVHALDMLQLVRIDIGRGISPTNMYRNRRHNISVGSKNEYSDHTYHEERSDSTLDTTFAGIDIPVFGKDDAERMEELAIKYGFNAIGRYPSRHFIHIGMRTRKPSGALYRWGKKWH